MSPVFLSPRQPGDSWESLHQNLTNKLPLYFSGTATEPECAVLAGDRNSSQVLEGWESQGQRTQLEGTTTEVPYIVDDLSAPKCLSISLHTGRYGPIFRTMIWFPYKYGGCGWGAVPLLTLLVTEDTFGASSCNGGNSDSTATQK